MTVNPNETTADRLKLLRKAVQELGALRLTIQGLYMQVSGEPEWKVERQTWADHEYENLGLVLEPAHPDLAEAVKAYLSAAEQDDDAGSTVPCGGCGAQVEDYRMRDGDGEVLHEAVELCTACEQQEAPEYHDRFVESLSFAKWCNEGGWQGVAGFEKSTGVTFAEIAGKWFTIVENRVFINRNAFHG